MVKEKVRNRVPWIVTNESETGLRSWNLCAKVVVSRSRRSLDGNCEGWKLVNDIRAATGGEIDVQKCRSFEIENDPFQIRRMVTSGRPIFAEVDIPVRDTDIKVRGMNVVVDGEQQELFHVEKKLNDTNKESHDTPKSREPPSSTPLPSVYLLNNLKTDIYIKDMNNNLLLVRINNETDCIIHKDMCLQDSEGNYIIDENLLTSIKPQKWYGKTHLTLLPGEMGALMVKIIEEENPDKYHRYYPHSFHPSDREDKCDRENREIYVHRSMYHDTKYNEYNTIFGTERYHRSYLAYVEPTVDLRHVILVTLPACCYEYLNASSFLFYNGYLFFCFEGRLIQLWVDLGLQKVLDMGESRQVLGHNELTQQYDTQALVGVNTAFPVMQITTIKKYPFDVNHHKVQQVFIRATGGLERYLSTERSYGRTFFDLLTGKTYSSERESTITVPCSLSGEIMFALSRLPDKPNKSRGRLELTTAIRDNVPQLVWVVADTGTSPEVHDSPHSEKHEQELEDHTVRDYEIKEEYYNDSDDFKSAQKLHSQLSINPPPLFPLYDMDALLAMPETYALQHPLHHSKYPKETLRDLGGYESHDDETVYDIRLERSRRRDYAFHHGEPYEKWRACDTRYDECYFRENEEYPGYHESDNSWDAVSPDNYNFNPYFSRELFDYE